MQDESKDATRNASVRRAVIAATVGTVIEWFDYALYGSAAALVINKLFFPQLSDTAGMLASFATFAVGFFARPLGGVILAYIGDRFGRKPALLLTIVLMGGATVAIGLLPTYQQLGIWAPVLLVFFRMLQGFGAGAEYAGAVTLVAEYAPPRHKGVLTAFLQSATLIGIALSTLTFLAVSYAPPEALLTWAWRLPFLFSGVLFFVALYIRNRLDETPEYVDAMAHAAQKRAEATVPLGELLRRSPRELFFGFLSVTGHNATAYLLAVYALSYMTNDLGFARTDGLIVVVIAALIGAVTTPLMGMFADRFGSPAIYLFGAIFMGLFAFPFFALMDSRDIVLAGVAMSLGYGIGFGAMAGAQGVFLANLFPTRYRFTGIAVARELNGLLIAGPTPFIAAALVAAGGGKPIFVSAYLAACCVATAIAVLTIGRQARGEHAT